MCFGWITCPSDKIFQFIRVLIKGHFNVGAMLRVLQGSKRYSKSNNQKSQRLSGTDAPEWCHDMRYKSKTGMKVELIGCKANHAIRVSRESPRSSWNNRPFPLSIASKLAGPLHYSMHMETIQMILAILKPENGRIELLIRFIRAI